MNANEHAGTLYGNASVAQMRVRPLRDLDSGLQSLALRVYPRGAFENALEMELLQAGQRSLEVERVVDFDVGATSEPHAFYKVALIATNRAGLRNGHKIPAFLFDPDAPLRGR